MAAAKTRQDGKALDGTDGRADPGPNPAEYAQVVKMLGNGRLEAMCFDGVRRLANIRGK